MVGDSPSRRLKISIRHLLVCSGQRLPAPCSSIVPCATTDVVFRRVRPRNAHAVEVDQVRRRISHPISDSHAIFREVTSYGRPVRDGSHVSSSGSRIGKETRRLAMSHAVDWPIARNGLDQEQPILCGAVQHNVGASD